MNYLLVFATDRLTVRAPVLRFRDEKNTRQSLDSLCDRASTGHEEGKTGKMVRTKLANPLFMSAIFG